jgi:hypothetical protein
MRIERKVDARGRHVGFLRKLAVCASADEAARGFRKFKSFSPPAEIGVDCFVMGVKKAQNKTRNSHAYNKLDSFSVSVRCGALAWQASLF